MQLEQPFQVVTPTLDGDVLTVLGRTERSFSARQLHRHIASHSEAGIRKALDRLVGQGTVIVEQAGQAKLYRLNRRHLAAPYIEGIARLEDELLEAIRAVLRRWKVKPAYAALFGSAATGEMEPESDIDVFLIRLPLGSTARSTWERQITSFQRDVSMMTGNDVRILQLSRRDASSAQHSELLEEIRLNGLRLYGRFPPGDG